MSVAMPRVMTRGVVFVHSTPTALCPHITWALESALDTRLSIQWTPQPAGASLVRAEFPWTGVQGTGAKLASALRGWDNLRYEVTEEPSPGADGSRWSHTPRLGIHHTWTSASIRRSEPSTSPAAPHDAARAERSNAVARSLASSAAAAARSKRPAARACNPPSSA